MRSVLILWTVEFSLALSVSGQYWGQKDLCPVEMAILGSPSVTSTQRATSFVPFQHCSLLELLIL